MAEDRHTHAQQQYVRLSDAKKSHIFYGTRLSSLSCYCHLKRPPKELENFTNWYFYTMIFQGKLYKLHYTCYEAHTLKRFQIVTHSCTSSFSIKTRFYETKNIFSLTDLRKNIKNFWKYIHNESIFSFYTSLCNIFKNHIPRH